MSEFRRAKKSKQLLSLFCKNGQTVILQDEINGGSVLLISNFLDSVHCSCLSA